MYAHIDDGFARIGSDYVLYIAVVYFLRKITENPPPPPFPVITVIITDIIITDSVEIIQWRV